jgi:hypothetical protein
MFWSVVPVLSDVQSHTEMKPHALMHDHLSSVFAPSAAHPRVFFPRYSPGNPIHRRSLFARRSLNRIDPEQS